MKMIKACQVLSLLSPYCALDLTDEKGHLCGKILADLGAKVIKVEPLGGDPSRSIGPFYKDIPHPEKSLSWFAFNSGKKSITLNIEQRDGKTIFCNLVKGSDFVIESYPPGYMEEIGLDYSRLKEVNRRIIMTSITPFGQDGPYRGFKGSDIAVWALGGMLNVCGDPDRPPVRISFPTAYLHAGAAASAATLMAHYHREAEGTGQHIDISAQQCVEWATAELIQTWEMNQQKVKRSGSFRVRPSTGAKLREIWPCKDGFVCFRIMGGKSGAGFMNSLVDWMDHVGMGNDYLRLRNWEELDLGKVTQEEYDIAESPIAKFFLKFTKAELYEEATRRRIQLYPINTNEDILKDPQLDSRGFWKTIDHSELGIRLVYPGAFAKFSQTSCGPQHRAPFIGEHNKEIYMKKLGLADKELGILKKNGVI